MGRASPVQLTIPSEHSRRDCDVANNSNEGRNPARERADVLRYSEDTLCHFARDFSHNVLKYAATPVSMLSTET